MQTPKVCLTDSRLRSANIHTNGMGVPLAASGKSAVVFRATAASEDATAASEDIALRCFTRASSDQRLRYQALHAHLGPALPWYMVDFAYRDQEILVTDTRYPLVEMDWVEGDPLDKWVQGHLGRGRDLEDQAAAWLVIADDMLTREMAHGDIANDNCLVHGDQLKLVDYDGCFIPDLADKNPGEAGAPHFQHPGRSGHYAGNMDAFPALVVYLSLLALQSDKSLWRRFHQDKNLIFMATDYAAPQQTPVWDALAKSPDARVVALANALASMCRKPIASLPSIRDVVTEAGIPVERPGLGANGQNPADDWPPWWQQPAMRTGPGPETVPAQTPGPDRPGPTAAWWTDHQPDGSPSPTQPVPASVTPPTRPLPVTRQRPPAVARPSPGPAAPRRPASPPPTRRPPSRPPVSPQKSPAGTVAAVIGIIVVLVIIIGLLAL